MEKLGLILTRALFRVKVGQKSHGNIIQHSRDVNSFLERMRHLQRSR